MTTEREWLLELASLCDTEVAAIARVNTVHAKADRAKLVAEAKSYRARAATLATPPPVDPPPVDPPPVDPPPVEPPPTSKDRTSPLLVAAGATESGWHIHGIAGTGYPTAVDLLDGATFADSLIEDCWQAVFAAQTVTVRNVRVRRAGVPGQQAHHFYVRHGLLDRCVAESFKTDAGHGSCSFHGHQHDGPVSDLEWRYCEDYTPNDAIAAGDVRVERFRTVQFYKPAGKTRVGVPSASNGPVWLDFREAANLQLDGSFAAGSTVSGRVHELTTAGGPGMTLAAARAQWPTIDFTGLTIG